MPQTHIQPEIYAFAVQSQEHLADMVTPVTAYLAIRDAFPGSHLLESADSHGAEGSVTYLAINPIASISVSEKTIETLYPDGRVERREISERGEVLAALRKFQSAFAIADDSSPIRLFGYFSYEAVRWFETVELTQTEGPGIPEIRFELFEYLVRVDHYHNLLSVSQLTPADNSGFKVDRRRGSLDELVTKIFRGGQAVYPFQASGDEESNMTSKQFCDIVDKCKGYIRRGDVFQIVPSRRFSRKFQGDPFAVYRSLRSINPSPYLFFFDYGNAQIFGSSPESQILIENGEASIRPIAGTYRRSGTKEADLALAEKLTLDPKEGAEHVMLVDLARNDLSRHCDEVSVATFKEVQFFSHVLHMVSRVIGKLRPNADALGVVADTFPAGTLSGAPKYRAMELIDRLEVGKRGIYGGAIGLISSNGEVSLSILIRSFLAHGGKLHYQAGCGVVADSVPETEDQEVRNKLAALNRAVELAQEAR